MSETAPPAAIDTGIFRAYDIRGITTENLTEEVVYWIGRSFATASLAQQQSTAVVGRDGRLSSPSLEASLTRGLCDGGLDVISVGLVPTPLLYFATYELQTGTGIMITGSHNPPEYNGLKMMIGGVTLAEERIQVLLQNLQNNTLSKGTGRASETDIIAAYTQKLLPACELDRPLKVVIDCGNGVAGVIAPDIIKALGCQVTPLYCEVDGNFPNHHPDPAEPENLEDVIKRVREVGADVGLAFDGDGDRLGVVTPKGEIIWPDKLMMFFAEDICARHPGETVIFDVKCSRYLPKVIREAGGEPLMWKTGHSHIKAKIKETQSPLAGEFSGHLCIVENWYGFDDAIFSAGRLLQLLSKTAASADGCFAKYPVTVTTPEIKIQTSEEHKFVVMQKLAEAGDFGSGEMTQIDGIRVDFDNGWGLIRPSNTSPVLSLRFEADTEADLQQIQNLFQTQLQKVDSSLAFL
ncbi:MAG: phosphomannomutase/phosphoglucomutase [Pseudomonadota bacterium]|nr:phosphomannomutase/phosphoglucomutase [Pseudomonadota bacterium]